MNIPDVMKALVQRKNVPSDELLRECMCLADYFDVEEAPVPKPAAGECLIKVSRGTLNHNDFLHARGTYAMSEHIELPRPMGFEGAGEVVACNNTSWFSPAKVGTRVVFYNEQGGVFGQYICVDAMSVIPIPEGVGYETAACSVANPFTALLMVRKVRNLGHKVFINTAAAGALGRMLIRIAKSRGMEVICVVRREEQADICRNEGAIHVVNSSDGDFLDKLKQVTKETSCRYAYDCISGPMPDVLLQALPEDSIVSVYGEIAGTKVTIDTNHLVMNRQLHHFSAFKEMKEMNWLSKMGIVLEIRNGMGKEMMKSDVQKSFPLEKAHDAFAYYATSMTGGKVQIVADSTIH